MIDYRNVRAEYEVWLLTDRGVRIASLNGFQSLSYTKAVNSAGAFSITMPHTFDKSLAAKDRIVMVYRKPYGGSLALDFAGIIEGISLVGKTPARVLTGVTFNGLLERRYCYYYSDSAQAKVNAQPIDNAMKEIVRDNLGATSTTGNGRYVANAIDASYFSVQSDLSLGTTTTKEFSWRRIADVLRELSEESRKADTEIFFDFVHTSESTFQFQTFKTQRGQDRRQSTGLNPVRFGVEWGNVDEPAYYELWSDEINYAIAGGRGEGASRLIGSSEDTTRSGVSIFGKTEGFTNATNITSTSTTPLDNAASALVTRGRPVRKFTGKLISTQNAQYGKEWGFGDYITVTYDGLQFDAMIKSISVSKDQSGDESIDARIEGYS